VITFGVWTLEGEKVQSAVSGLTLENHLATESSFGTRLETETGTDEEQRARGFALCKQTVLNILNRQVERARMSVPMNFRRGLIRLWIVGSVAWIVALWIDYYLKGCLVIGSDYPSEYWGLQCPDPTNAATNYWNYPVRLLDLVLLTFGVPALALAAAFGVGWIIIGFGKQSSS
jgi:hypothetical protein